MGNTYGFSNTNTALTALADKLTALQWTPEGGPAQNAFAKVALFDMTNLAVALRELMSYADRVCLIVHDSERFENEHKNRELRTRQRRDVQLLIADRQIANRQAALSGDNKTPGVLALKDIVLGAVVGPLVPGVFIQPEHGEQMILSEKARAELTGRVAFVLGLQIVGGNIITDLGPQPIP